MQDQDSLPAGSIEDVQQEEFPIVGPPVPVMVQNVVPVHETGSRHGVSFNRKLNSVDLAVKILSANPKRRKLQLLCDQQFYVNVSEAGLSTGTAALWLANVPLSMSHTEEVWVYLPIDGQISVLTEDWAD